MNDEQLDLELRSLFATDRTLTVNVDGLVATELRDSIVASAHETPADESSNGERQYVAMPVLERTDVQPRDANSRTGRSLLVAAAVTVIALLGIGAWARSTNDSPVVSNVGLDDEPDHDGPDQTEGDEGLAIRGPAAPLVVFLPTALDGTEEDIVSCIARLSIAGPPQMNVGFPAFVTTTIFGALDPFDQVVVAQTGTADVACSDRELDWSTKTTPAKPTDVDPVVITDWHGGDGVVSFEGQLLDNVAEVVIVEPALPSQVFRQSGDLFRIDAIGADVDSPAEFDNWEAEVRFDDGSVGQLTSEGPVGADALVQRCGTDAVCLGDRVITIAEAALTAGSRAQYDALSDGVLDQGEYDEALERFRACMGSGRLGAEPVFVVEGTPVHSAAVTCRNTEISFVEDARAEQNEHVLYLYLIRESRRENDDQDDEDQDGVVNEEVRVVLSPLLDVRTRLVSQPDVEMFTVESPLEDYWRIAALDVFDGRIWRSRASVEDAEGHLDTTESVSFEVVTQSFEINNLSGIWLPAVYKPLQVLSSSSELEYEPQSGVLIVDEETVSASGLSYTLVSAVPERDIAAIADAAGSIPDEIAERYLALPDDFSERVRDKAQEIVASARATTPYEIALALQNYFRDPTLFTYDLDANNGHSMSRIEEFLFDTRSGYSEQFASSYATMARSVGLPARVAVGFTPGEFDPSIDAYRVSGGDAHAWPEVWMDGVGWLRFEPTPWHGSPQDEAYTGQTNED